MLNWKYFASELVYWSILISIQGILRAFFEQWVRRFYSKKNLNIYYRLLFSNFSEQKLLTCCLLRKIWKYLMNIEIIHKMFGDIFFLFFQSSHVWFSILSNKIFEFNYKEVFEKKSLFWWKCGWISK